MKILTITYEVREDTLKESYPDTGDIKETVSVISIHELEAYEVIIRRSVTVEERKDG